MKKKIALFIIPLAILTLTLSSCGLKRSNPLDPIANHFIEEPGRVLGIDLTVSPTSAKPRYIDIKWQKTSRAHGYYIYRARSINTSFERIATIDKNDVISYRDDKDIVSGRVFFYKMSAFLIYDEGTLEGQLSAPLGRQVN
ncbi:MAG: hypothetical protein WCX83_02720 [Candidatus Cloacimonas sp.]|nr:hypothetical protein [Candidatus Cloacimonadota bacterium]